MTCWLWHGERTRTRDELGRYVLRCQDCGHDVRLLASEVRTDGPQHQAAEVPGKPSGRVWREATRSKVAAWKKA